MVISSGSSKTVIIQDAIQEIIGGILKHETERHQLCINTFARRNKTYSTFMHGGETFRPINAPATRRVALDEHLWPDMEKFLLDRKTVTDDSKMFWQVLFNLLEPCQSPLDMRDALPDFLIGFAPEVISKYFRTRQEAWSLKGNLRAIKQYDKAVDKMKFYIELQKNPGLATLISFYNFEV